MRLIRNVRGWIESHNYCFILLYFFFYMTVFYAGGTVSASDRHCPLSAG